VRYTTLSSADLKALLGRIVVIDSAEHQRQLSARLARITQPTSVGFVNQHGLNLSFTNPGFHDSLQDCDVLLRDGAGMKLAMQLFDMAPGINMNGTDYIPQLLAEVRATRDDCSLHLYGTRQPWLGRAADKLGRLLDLPVVSLDGFLPAEHYAHAARADQSGFKIIVLAMGMPKQEQAAYALKRTLQGPVLIICGGAILDFLADRVTRAPRWMQRAGLEWAYRLLREPRRLFRRYVIGIPYFFARVVAARIRNPP
jgi:exopolysaccharide biosynthesis WecB/TagA/CpsF family protein